MIIFDTETTGLDKPELTPLDQQPEIIELGAVRLDDDTLVETAHFTTLVRPRGLPLPAKITEITGLRDSDLKGQRPFSAHYADLADFFCGERILVGHNIGYDVRILGYELARMAATAKFPWPMHHKCTVELNAHRFKKWPKQDELYQLYFGKLPDGAHRALNDVRNLADCVRMMRKDGLL